MEPIEEKETTAVPAKKIRKHPVLGKPILGAILLMIHGICFCQILSFFGKTQIALSLLSVVNAVLLLLIHKFWFRPEFKGSISFEFTRDHQFMLAAGLFLLVDIIAAVISYIDHGIAAPTLLGICLSLGAGTVEEVIFRVLPVSVMMRTYKDKGSYLPALILTPIIFGAIHMGNVLTGQAVGYTVLQSVSAAALGVFFGALYIRTGSIVPSMIIHVLHDFLGCLQANQTAGVASGSVTVLDIITIILIIAASIATAVVVLKGKADEIREVWNGVWMTPPTAESRDQRPETR